MQDVLENALEYGIFGGLSWKCREVLDVTSIIVLLF